MAAVYPGTIFTPLVRGANLSSPQAHTAIHDQIRDELLAVQSELGTNPKGSSATVKARLDAIDVRVAYRATYVGGAPIANNTFVKLVPNAEQEDTHGFSPANGTLTIPTGQAGYYACHGHALFASSHAVQVFRTAMPALNLDKPGGAVGGSATAVGEFGFPCMFLSVGTTIEFYVFQGSGGSVSITNASWTLALIQR